MTKAKKIDLRSLDTGAACDKGFEFELVHPVSKEPVGSYVTVVGKDSKAFREHVRRASNDRLRRQAQQQRRGKDVEIPTVEQIETEAIELLVSCTTGWREIELDGEELKYSEANARKLYTELPWVRSQVDEAIGDLENFMKG